MGLPPVNNNKQEPYSGEGSKQPNKGLDKPQGMKGEQPKNDGDRPQGSMRTTGEAPKAKDEQQWKTVTRKERQIRKPEMMASTDTKATKATTQIASGDTKGKPVEAVNMSKINSMYRNLGTHAWADSDEEDDDYDPYPEMPAPNQSGNDGDIGADENFDLDEELFAERVVADGTVAIRDLDGVVHMWDKAAQRMMPMSRADAILTFGPQYAPGMQNLASSKLQPPKANILQGMKYQEGTLMVKADRLAEHLQHGYAIGAIDKETMSVLEKDGRGRVPLIGELAAAMIKVKNVHVEILQDQDSSLRRDKMDNLLRDGRVQRYSMTFIKNKLANLRKQGKRSEETMKETQRQQDALAEEKRQWIQARQEGQLCGIPKLRKETGQIRQTVRECADNLASEGSMDNCAKLTENVGKVFDDCLVAVEEQMEALRQIVKQEEAVLHDLQQQRHEAKKSSDSAADLNRLAESRAAEVNAMIAASVKAQLETYAEAAPLAKAEIMVKHRMPALEDEAWLQAQLRVYRIAETDPAFVIEIAKDVVLRLKDDDMVRIHQGMVKNPKARPKGIQGSHK